MGALLLRAVRAACTPALRLARHRLLDLVLEDQSFHHAAGELAVFLVELPRRPLGLRSPAPAQATYVRLSHLSYQAGLQQAAWPSSCMGGQGTDPNEQNTQQSPGLGRKTVRQLSHS